MAVKQNNRLPDFLRDLSPPSADNSAGYRLLHDPEVRGFVLRITRTGTKSWVHSRNGQSQTIGRYSDWTYAQARDKARELNRLIDEARTLAPNVTPAGPRPPSPT